MGDTAEARSNVETEIPHCTICFCEYGSGLRKPWDLGCGHCVCNRCYANLSITGPQTCPIDRKEWNNPHPAWELLSVIEQLQRSRGKVESHDDSSNNGIPGAPHVQMQPQAPRRRWVPPDPFRPAAGALLFLSDLWRAVLWPQSSGGGGGDWGDAGGLEMGLREAMGHIAIAAPPWVHVAWRLVVPGLGLLTAQFLWRYLAAIALLLVPLLVAVSAGYEVRGRTWTMIAACTAAGLLGSASCHAALLRHGLLQHLLAASLAILLSAGMQHARVCDCLLARTCRNRAVQVAAAAAIFALWWLGLAGGLRRGVVQAALRWWLRLGAAGTASWPGGGAVLGVRAPSGIMNGMAEAAAETAEAAATATESSLWGWFRGPLVAASSLMAATARAAAGASEVPPLGMWQVVWLLARGALTPTLLLVAVNSLEDYRSALPAGGPSVLPGSRLGGTAAVYGCAYRYDLDWLLLRAVVWLGAWCCSGSIRVATALNVALQGCFLLSRLVALNSFILRIFRSESASAPAVAAARATGEAMAATAAAAVAASDRGAAAAAPTIGGVRRNREGARVPGAAGTSSTGAGEDRRGGGTGGGTSGPGGVGAEATSEAREWRNREATYAAFRAALAHHAAAVSRVSPSGGRSTSTAAGGAAGSAGDDDTSTRGAAPPSGGVSEAGVQERPAAVAPEAAASSGPLSVSLVCVQATGPGGGLQVALRLGPHRPRGPQEEERAPVESGAAVDVRGVGMDAGEGVASAVTGPAAEDVKSAAAAAAAGGGAGPPGTAGSAAVTAHALGAAEAGGDEVASSALPPFPSEGPRPDRMERDEKGAASGPGAGWAVQQGSPLVGSPAGDGHPGFLGTTGNTLWPREPGSMLGAGGGAPSPRTAEMGSGPGQSGDADGVSGTGSPAPAVQGPACSSSPVTDGARLAPVGGVAQEGDLSAADMPTATTVIPTTTAVTTAVVVNGNNDPATSASTGTSSGGSGSTIEPSSDVRPNDPADGATIRVIDNPIFLSDPPTRRPRAQGSRAPEPSGGGGGGDSTQSSSGLPPLLDNSDPESDAGWGPAGVPAASALEAATAEAIVSLPQLLDDDDEDDEDDNEDYDEDEEVEDDDDEEDDEEFDGSEADSECYMEYKPEWEMVNGEAATQASFSSSPSSRCANALAVATAAFADLDRGGRPPPASSSSYSHSHIRGPAPPEGSGAAVTAGGPLHPTSQQSQQPSQLQPAAPSSTRSAVAASTTATATSGTVVATAGPESGSGSGGSGRGGRARDLLAPPATATATATATPTAYTAARTHRPSGRGGGRLLPTGPGVSAGGGAGGRAASAAAGTAAAAGTHGGTHRGAGTATVSTAGATSTRGGGSGGRPISLTSSFLAGAGPPRGGLYDDIVWGYTAVVLMHWLLFMPPWRKLVLGFEPYLGPLAPNRLLGWGSVVVSAGLLILLIRLAGTDRLQGALRPCLADRAGGSSSSSSSSRASSGSGGGGGAGGLLRDPGGGSVVDVRVCLQFCLMMAIAPLVTQLLRSVWPSLAAAQLTISGNLELWTRLTAAFLQAVCAASPMPLSGSPAVPLITAIAGPLAPPSIWPRNPLNPSSSSSSSRLAATLAARVAPAAFVVLFCLGLGLEASLVHWMGMALEGAFAVVGSLLTAAVMSLVPALPGGLTARWGLGGRAAGLSGSGVGNGSGVGAVPGSGESGSGGGGGDRRARYAATAALLRAAGTWPEGAELYEAMARREQRDQGRAGGSGGAHPWWGPARAASLSQTAVGAGREGASGALRGRAAAEDSGRTRDEGGGGGGGGGGGAAAAAAGEVRASDGDAVVLVGGAAPLNSRLAAPHFGGGGGGVLTRRRLHARRTVTEGSVAASVAAAAGLWSQHGHQGGQGGRRRGREEEEEPPAARGVPVAVGEQQEGAGEPEVRGGTATQEGGEEDGRAAPAPAATVGGGGGEPAAAAAAMGKGGEGGEYGGC